ncbi:MAG: TonB-dependent receptor [Proteobacteria bacterium]|uniref:TonB-dependent receptor n=1 Tax=Rudaea sp. TaxID=2136325 RepID=UPI0037831B8C|nr:TonB-dependent receptor [Pseudomonadota bacterium]
MIQSSTSRTSTTPVRGLRKRPLAAACASALFLVASSALAADESTGATTAGSAATPAVAAGQAQSGTTPDQAKPADQKKGSGDATASLDTVTVTGIRGSIQSALSVKENLDSIAEAIAPEDLGKLPDLSIAESLARLPGLATQRVGGHAEYISIRGLSPDFVGTTLNGREQASTGENRGVQYDQYPAELMGGAVVYKVPDATVIGQGLSGTVDLHTIRPLDFQEMTMAANLRGERTTNGSLNPGSGVGKTGNRVSFSFVDQFLDHTLGVAFGVAHLDSPSQEKQYQAWWWSMNNGAGSIEDAWGGPHTPGMPGGVISEEGMQLRAQSQSQVRNGAIGIIEWAPNDHYHSTLDIYYSKFDQEKYKNGLQWSSSPWDGIAFSNVGTSLGGPYPIATSGTIDGLQPIMQNEYTKEKDYLFSAGWNNRFEFDNQWQVTADLSYSRAKVKLHDAYAFTGLAGGAKLSTGFTMPAGEGYPTFTPAVDLSNPANLVFADPTNYSYNGRAEWDRQKDEIKAFRLEASHPLGWIFSAMNFGFDYSERTKSKQADVFFAYLNGNGCSTSYAGPTGNLPATNPQCQSPAYDPHHYVPIGSSLDGSTSLAYGGIGGIAYYDVLSAIANQFYLIPKSGQNDWNRNYSITEKVPLAYVKLNIDTTLWDIPIRGNIGGQFVRTEVSSSAIQTSGDTYVGTLQGSNSYNKFLPSLNLVADFGDRTYLRFGLAKTMVRGRIDDEKIASSAGVSPCGGNPPNAQCATVGNDPTKGTWNGSGGNIFLKPWVAVGTDLSLEKYFGEASYVSAAVFNKNLLTYIYNQTVENYNFAGYTNPTPNITAISSYGTNTVPQNGAGGSIQGVELAAALEGKLLASWLDGFGIQGNFAYNKSKIPTSTISQIPGGPTTLPGLSAKTGNITVYYEKAGYSVRLAQRYRSEFTGEAVALFDQIGYTKILADKQTDFQAGYEFQDGRMKGLSVLLQVNNLTDSPYRTQQVSGLPNGVSVARPLEYDTYGRTILLGLNYKL